MIHPRKKFTPEEDKLLTKLINKYGTDNWFKISKQMKGRKSRQCRDRWLFYLNPDINNGEWKAEEDELLQKKYEELGPCWKKIATFLTGRTEISVKNRWNKIQRKIAKNSKSKDLINKIAPINNQENNKKLDYDDFDFNLFEWDSLDYDLKFDSFF